MYAARNAHAPYCHLWSARLYRVFPHYLINGNIFGEKKLMDTKCVFWFSLQLLCETFPPLRIQRHIIIYVYYCSCVVAVILVGFQWNFNFLHRFSRNTQISNFGKCVQREPTYSMRADGRTGMTKLIAFFAVLRERLKRLNFTVKAWRRRGGGVVVKLYSFLAIGGGELEFKSQLKFSWIFHDFMIFLRLTSPAWCSKNIFSNALLSN